MWEERDADLLVSLLQREPSLRVLSFSIVPQELLVGDLID